MRGAIDAVEPKCLSNANQNSLNKSLYLLRTWPCTTTHRIKKKKLNLSIRQYVLLLMEEILHPQQIMNRMRHQILDRHEHTWTHDEEGEKKHTTHKHISKRHMKNTQSKSKNQTFHQMWFFVLWFLFAFFHTTKTHVWFLLIHYGNSSTQTVETPNRTSRNIYVPSSRRITTLHKLRLRWWGKAGADSFCRKPNKKQKKHTYNTSYTPFLVVFCCKGVFCVSPSGSPTNRLGKTDPTWRIGGRENIETFWPTSVESWQWRAGELLPRSEAFTQSITANLDLSFRCDGFTSSKTKKTRMVKMFKPLRCEKCIWIYLVVLPSGLSGDFLISIYIYLYMN